MNRFIGIDQSYSGFSIAVINPDESYEVHRRAFKGKGITRLVDVEAWLYERLYDGKTTDATFPTHVCLEGYASGAKYGRELAGELGATVKRTLWNSLPEPVRYPTIVQPTLLKKFVLGKGVGSKAQMLLGVFQKWDVAFSDDNEADAYALARIAEAVHTRKVSYQYQQEVLDKLTPHTERP